MKNKRSRFRVLLALVLAFTILVLPLDTLALSAFNHTATPDEALPTQRAKDNAQAAVGAGGVVEVNGTEYSTLNEALSAWTAGSTLKLLSDVTTGSTITVPTGEHTLDLNGYGILMTGNNRVITINQNASLELNDSNPDKIHYITLTDYRGTAVSDSGEVSVSGGNGVIRVKGGYLTGGYLNNTGSHDKCGAGIFNWGTFVMNGGSIVGNTMQNNSGAGIRNSGYFTMNGGTIAFNKATNNGGGVTTYVPGGGQGKMTMTGGEISDNYCGRYGGGLQLAGPFELAGGSVIRNTADIGGSGIYYSGKGDRFKLSGNPIIKDNINDDLYLDTDATFMINGSLTEEADIGILMKNNDVFTVGWKDNMGSADPSKYFTSDDSNYAVILNNNGEAEIGVPPAASIISGETTTSYSSFPDALSAWSEGSTLKLMSDVTTNSTITVLSGEHTLDLNGHGIKMTGSGGVIKIPSDADLTLIDSRAEGNTHYYYIDSATNLAVLASTQESAQSNNAGKNGSFTGGYITGGNNPSGSGEGGGGISVLGKLTMNNGTVIGNYVAGAGGGISVNNNGNASFTGTNIIGNKTGNVGGGVDIANVGTPTATLVHCVIRHNHANSNTAGIAARGGSVALKDCDVLDNSAQNNAAGFGAQNCHVTLEDVRVKGNVTANSSNVYAPGITLINNNYTKCSFTIKGTVTIVQNTMAGKADDSIFFHNGRKLSAGGELTNTAPIKIRLQSGTGVFTSGWKDNMGSADPAKYFTSDNSDYAVALADGEAVISYPELSGVTASGFEGGYDGKAHGITVSAPDGATIEYGTAEGSYTLTGSPTYTDAGSYTVYYKVSLDDYTPVSGSAQVKINQINAAVTITGSNGTFDYDGMKHTVSGYTAKADTTLYDVTKDFSFSGNAEVYRTDAGKSMMGLAVNMFTNTNGNFNMVTFNITDGYVTVDQIDAAVTITGHTNTVDYNGSAHSADGYDAVASSALYDVTKDFTYNGRAEAVRTNAGTTYMGLTGEKFENKNSNFKTVTFNVTDGYQQINPIDVTVTITGHNSTVNYDGRSHSADGYDAAAGSDLYDVTKDFTFSGSANAERTNAGTTAMGLAVNQFENTNANFKTVTFDITDGYIRVNTVDAVITSAPHAKDSLVYNGSSQELVVAGTAEGGTMYYAIGSDSRSAPADSAYKTPVPTGTEVGNYYIWYKVIADSNHDNTSPACVKVTLAEKTWTTVSGKVYDSNNNPIKDATVSLSTGNKTVDTIISESDGSYYFTAPAGVYNIIVKANGATVTDMVDISDSKTYDLNIVDANTDSLLDVSGTDSEIVVGGLNKEAESIRTSEGIASDKNVTVRMTVTPVSVGSTDAVSAIEEYAAEMNLEYYDFKVEKTIGSTTSYLDSTQTVLEIVIPCSFTNKQEVTVYRADGSGVQTLTESDSKEAGTFRVDANSGLVYIYTNEITTYALGYKPYYSIRSEMLLGGFMGSVNVTLTKNGEAIYKLTDVPSDNVSFKGVPKGNYSMTITWTDGAENTLTTPFIIN